MTPQRWLEIDDLFHAAVRIAPDDRAAWLRTACGDDEGLLAEVDRLLADDARAGLDGFLIPPEPASPPPDPTRSWHPGNGPLAANGPGKARAAGLAASALNDDAGGFTPRAAIAPRTSISEPREVVQARLGELPIIYILLLGIAILWRRAVFGQEDPTLARLDFAVILGLLGVMAALRSPWAVPLSTLKALELGMIGLLAGRLAFTQYRLMLSYSLRDDPMMAQLTMKNIVLLTSILILTYGLYVPKSWRRAAWMAGPLALMPFATLLVLTLAHPEPMAWLVRGWRKSQTPRYWLFSFDAMILIILAFGSTFGARTISRLRRQVAEARQLGQYRLRKLIGAGGMGEVYLAEHQLLKRPCAVKLIRPGVVADRVALERFEREVRLTATLSHPNTVEVYDYGRSEDGTYYYVMEYLPGLNLAELVDRHGPLPPARAVYLLRQVCGALREAHAAGLIHRDLKPSNIFAARQGGMDDVAKLLDFGLVRPSTTARSSHLSVEGQVLGTPQFMSPEQATGRAILDERSDIYSLGAVAYHLLTGRPPFDGDGGIAVLIAHARDPVVPPSRIEPGIPDDLEQVVLRCLAKPPADRFPDAASLDRALRDCTCAADWDQDHAARWWHDADHPSTARMKTR